MDDSRVVCVDCKEVVPPGGMYVRRGKPTSRCRACQAAKQAAYRRTYRQAHPERIRAYKREVYRRDPEKTRAAWRRWNEANPEKIVEYRRHVDRRADRLRRTHGITLEQFYEMWDRQDGKCPICLRELPREFLNREELHAAPVKPHVDHCHATDVVRGILCSTCNQAIGHLREDPENFRRAVEYLSGKYPTITPQRVAAVPNREKTHCKRNHPLDEANTYIHPGDGSRHCRTCNAMRDRARRAR